MDPGGTSHSGAKVDSRRQIIQAIVDDTGEPVHVDELAERLVKQGETVMSAEEYRDAVERELISLHHNVLPKLAQSGLIDYDAESNIVSTNNDGVVDIEWLNADPIAEALSNLRLDRPTDSDTVGVLHGRQTAIEYGRALTDKAEDELFCMFVDTDLLEDECFCRAEDAIARGVEIYMGSRNEDVRTLTRRRLPEATIWEPQRGWLNAPFGYPKVGRLVFVDRREVMFAILEEPGPDGEYPNETAMVGEGEDNPLVILVRELLGPRLDHLDYQSSDFRSQLRTGDD